MFELIFQELLEQIEKEKKEKKAKGRRMQIEDVEGDDEEESLAKGDNSEVKAEKEPKVEQSALKANDKPARRMKIQEVESDDEECEEIVINGHASKKEQTENSSKQLNGGVSDAAKVDKDIGKVKNEGMDNSKEVTKNDKETIGRKSPVAVEEGLLCLHA